jgi:hypothetical protein
MYFYTSFFTVVNPLKAASALRLKVAGTPGKRHF